MRRQGLRRAADPAIPRRCAAGGPLRQPGRAQRCALRMANTPEGAILIDNPVSAAPGFQIGNVYVMAGVPTIMQAMFDGRAAPAQGRGADAVAHRRGSTSAKASSPRGWRAPGALRRSGDRQLSRIPAWQRAVDRIVIRGTEAARRGRARRGAQGHHALARRRADGGSRRLSGPSCGFGAFVRSWLFGHRKERAPEAAAQRRYARPHDVSRMRRHDVRAQAFVVTPGIVGLGVVGQGRASSST